MENYIVFFDGVCNLCNSTVQFLIKKDKKKILKFASLQSKIGQKFLSERGLQLKQFDSIILYTPNTAYYIKSTAVLKIVKILGYPYNLLSVFYLLPVYIRDLFYNFIAKNRYKWFGKNDSCALPSPELKDRFLL